jgi:hypothetical protein
MQLKTFELFPEILPQYLNSDLTLLAYKQEFTVSSVSFWCSLVDGTPRLARAWVPRIRRFMDTKAR